MLQMKEKYTTYGQTDASQKRRTNRQKAVHSTLNRKDERELR